MQSFKASLFLRANKHQEASRWVGHKKTKTSLRAGKILLTLLRSQRNAADDQLLFDGLRFFSALIIAFVLIKVPLGIQRVRKRNEEE